MRPACLAKSGSRSGPKTSRATTPITMNSAKPIPIMAGPFRGRCSELAGRRESELHAREVAAAADEPLRDLVEGPRCGRAGLGHHDRPAGVAPLAQPRVERHLAEDLHRVAEPLGQRL